MSESLQQPTLLEVGKPINLVPVGLKEAALDSPSFRAGFTHFSEQLDLVERWLDSYIKSISKLSHEIAPLESLLNGFFTQSALPLNVSEAVIDHDYTLLAMKRYGEGARDYWGATIASLRKMEANMVEPIRSFLLNDLRAFKEIRRQFELAQKQLDNVQGRYCAQSKTKEASALREDAFQLYESRKAYLKLSMDFSVTAPQLRMALDKTLVKIFSDQWREMRGPRDNLIAAYGRWDSDIERVRGWTREIESGDKTIQRELLNARKQIEESTDLAMRPSRELEDYTLMSSSTLPSFVNLQTPIKSGQTRAEKQGWLNLRTVTGKPSRTIWLRRWFFVKNGIFGWLVQGSRSGGVEEGEKIGVLLCSVRPATTEERRFCFEVKTKDRTIIVQAEAQPEFTEWVRSFELAKQKALEDPASTDSPSAEGPRGQDAAFAILPPTAPEFAASAADAGLQSLGDESASTSFERSATLPKSGPELNPNLTLRSSFDSRRSTADGDTGRDHASRIIQKLDLHRKSTIGPQVTGVAAASSSSSASVGGIASLISASHHIMPLVPPPAPEVPLIRPATMSTIRDLPISSLAPNTLANPPAPTNLSSMAIICNGERGIGMGRTDATGGMPGGLMANIWGTTNWGYLNRLERGELKSPPDSRLKPTTPPSPQPTLSGSPPTNASTENDEMATSLALNVPSTPRTSPRHRKTISLGSEDTNTPKVEGIQQEYPNYYPLQLKTQDSQFHLFFPNVREKVVLVFRATWSLDNNDHRGFPGRVYVTSREIFFYSHYLGLILISGVSLTSIVEVTAAPGRECDFLFLHLIDKGNQTGSTRIAIKTFLEPLKLLHKRLNFLARNCQTEEPLDMEAIMKNLIQLEQEDPAESPSLQSWEDISKSSFYDGANNDQKPNTSYKTQQDLRTAVLVDSAFDRPAGKIDEIGKDVTKFKLPRQPVIYAPVGMDPAIVEKEFEVSPKALFHVLFGDKSAVWQLLYHERQALHIKQGSWVQPEKGHLRRQFDYQISYHGVLGQARQTTIVDWQIIDVLNDHLCYVVTDRKTPWYLPYNRSFLLLNKIVITHVAKSKCKLAIYAKVDWLGRPGFTGGLITNRALHDLELDAKDLADVVAEQVRRLGPHSRTKKAVQIFGQVGQQTQASEFAGSDSPSNIRTRRSMKRRTMLGLFFERAALLATSIFTTLITWALAVLKWVWKTCDANSILLAVLAVSVCTNLIFSSWSTRDWWRERNASKFMARLGITPDPVMSKAIYIQDIHDASTTLLDEQSSTNQCLQTFQDLTSSTSSPFATPLHGSTSRTSRRLQRTRQNLGSYRHDLLVAIRVVNSIEREVVQAEYEDWLMVENSRCAQLQAAIRANATELRGQRLVEVRSWQGEYCESCGLEGERVFGSEEKVVEV